MNSKRKKCSIHHRCFIQKDRSSKECTPRPSSWSPWKPPWFPSACALASRYRSLSPREAAPRALVNESKLSRLEYKERRGALEPPERAATFEPTSNTGNRHSIEHTSQEPSASSCATRIRKEKIPLQCRHGFSAFAVFLFSSLRFTP